MATYPGAQRAAALSTWGALGGGGAAAGVLAGGILTSWLGWRSVFLVNVPVGVVAGLLSLRLVPSPGARARVRRELDLPGALLVVAGLARRTGIDPWPARLLFVLLGILLHASLILIYVILWILMPADETVAATVWTPEQPASTSH